MLKNVWMADILVERFEEGSLYFFIEGVRWRIQPTRKASIKYKKNTNKYHTTKAGAGWLVHQDWTSVSVGAADFTFSCIGVNLQISHLSNLHCRAKLARFAGAENISRL